MTENEAIEKIKDLSDMGFQSYRNAKGMAISALREIQQYREIGTVEEVKSAKKYIDLKKRCGTPTNTIDLCAEYVAIGTVEECRESVEKQKAKKPILINSKEYAEKIVNSEFLDDAYFCPNCKAVLRSGRYCNRCGQKLKWR